MLPGEGGLFDDHMLSVGLGVDVLHHDHGIGARGQGMAGIDPEGVGADGQAQGPPGRGGEGGFGVDGDAVHGRAVEGRGRAARGHGLGQHAVQGRRQGHALRGQLAALGADAVQPALAGGLHGLQSQIGMTFAFHKYLPISRMEAGRASRRMTGRYYILSGVGMTSFPVPALERGRHFKNDRRSVPFIKRIGGKMGARGKEPPFCASKRGFLPPKRSGSTPAAPRARVPRR